MFRRLFIRCSLAVGVFIGMLQCMEAQAQVDPRAILWEVIRQLQTGNPNPTWYGPQLWQVIAMQTGNSGIYPQLAQLGVVSTIDITQQQQLPQGVIYSMTAHHQGGTSSWNFGINTFTNRIEYANFNIGQPLPLPSVPGNPQPPNPTTPLDPSDPKPAPGPGSSSCQKFPDLC